MRMCVPHSRLKMCLYGEYMHEQSECERWEHTRIYVHAAIHHTHLSLLLIFSLFLHFNLNSIVVHVCTSRYRQITGAFRICLSWTALFYSKLLVRCAYSDAYNCGMRSIFWACDCSAHIHRQRENQICRNFRNTHLIVHIHGLCVEVHGINIFQRKGGKRAFSRFLYRLWYKVGHYVSGQCIRMLLDKSLNNSIDLSMTWWIWQLFMH